MSGRPEPCTSQGARRVNRHPLRSCSENAGTFRFTRFDVTALRVRPIRLAITLSASVPNSASCAGVHSLPAQRPTGLCPDRLAAADFTASSAAVHTFAFTAAPPFSAAVRIARLLPFVVARPPTRTLSATSTRQPR